MIVPMKKVTVLVLDSHKDRELARLKRLGLLHPDIERRTSEDAEALAARRDALSRALTDLPAETEVEQSPMPGLSDDIVAGGLAKAAEISALAEGSRTASEALERWRRELIRIGPWGNFEPSDISALAGHEVAIHLYSMSPKQFRADAPVGAILLERTGKAVFFALVWLNGTHSSGHTPEELAARGDFQEFAPPEVSAAQIRSKIAEEDAELVRIAKSLAAYSADRKLLAAAGDILEHRIEHEHVRLGMDRAENVAFISGYVPADSEDTLRTAASNNGWGLLFREPSADDPVPTKLTNPRWIRIIRPVFNMLGVVPGYRERDISMWFLLFFTVFVGMIIGDAGYGALLLTAAIFGIISGKRKTGRVSDGVALLTVLSLGTLGWGAITGNWFGFEPIGEMRPFSYVVIPALDSFDPRSVRAVQSFCFMLAALHLSIAHIWNFIREIRESPPIKAFAQLGWLSAVLGLYFLVVSLFVGQAMPQYALYMIVGGIGGVFLFSGQSPDRGFFGGIVRGLSNAFTIVFDGIGAFSDIISYIRLFAVGLASVAIAQAFNEMAGSVASGPVGIVLAVVIVFFGHSLNLVMGGLAVVVHGVRLNLLEFSGHVGMEWTGVEYRPFAENEENT
ncbi:MAG: V-type ATP synthase subunit I [Spirochaetia bacterium]